MTAYIKLSTSEYPRHIGDIEIDSAGMADYALVNWVAPPAIDPASQRCFEGPPMVNNGMWIMTWVVRDATPAELEYAARKQDVANSPGSTPDVIG
jgi:hypothetical protein